MTQGTDRNQPTAPVDTMADLKMVLSVAAIEQLAQDVIARLGARRTEAWTPPEDTMRSLCRALIARYPYAAGRLVQSLLDAGEPVDRIYRGYLAEAARRLGAMWDEDTVTFEQVGIATTRIYLIVDDLRRRVPAPQPSGRPVLVFAVVPGEVHTLGVDMATDLFRQRGWDVLSLVDHSHEEILAAVADPDVALIGLSTASRRQRFTLLRLVVALRVLRPELRILLSGAMATSTPDAIAQIGIDAVVRNVPEALEVVREWIDLSGAPLPQSG